MGRELKRVPLDFNWPRKRIWEGFINPFYKFSKNCPFCDGSGESPASKILSDQWYGRDEKHPFRPEDNGSVPLTIDQPAVRHFATKNAIQSDFCRDHGFDQGITLYWEMFKRGETDTYLAEHPYLESDIQHEARRLIAIWNQQWSHHLNQADVDALLKEGRLTDFTSYPRTEEQKAEYDAVQAWNNAEREKMKAEDWKGKPNWKKFHNGYKPTAQEVNEWTIMSMGHDSINSWVCVKAKLKRLKFGLSKCAHCKGHGNVWLSPEYKWKAEHWKQSEPPTGDGFQLWETTSEGSPDSPVFASFEELCEWCADNATTFASFKATKEEWMKILDADFVCHTEGNMVFL